MFYVVTTDTQRQATWERFFGVERLPVKANRPRPQLLHGETVLAFDLDAARLHPMARRRFADYVSRRTGHVVLAAEVDGWPLRASGLMIETAVSSEVKRPFVFARGAYA